MILDLGHVPFGWMVGFDHDEWHAQFQRQPVQIAYRALVRVIAKVLYGPVPYLYQAEPNLRIHPPDGVAVPWHSDTDFGHLPEEWNIWVPLTATSDDTQRLWVDPDGTPQPVHVPLTKAYVFPGRMRHGNMVNTTEVARVSFDFRLLARDFYRDTGAKTVLYGVPLRLGDYWLEMTTEP